MRLLITLAAAAALAACSHQSENNGVGQAPPETGRVSPSDTARNLPPPAPAPIDTAAKRDTTMAAPPPTTPPPTSTPTTPDTSSTIRHDSM